MRVNEGLVDRVLRTLVGIGLLSLTFVGPKTPWGYVGILPLLTAVVGFCPLYALLGMSTCRSCRRDAKRRRG